MPALTPRTVAYLIHYLEADGWNVRSCAALVELEALQAHLRTSTRPPLVFSPVSHPDLPIEVWQLGSRDNPVILELPLGSEISAGLGALWTAVVNQGVYVILATLDSRTPERWSTSISRARERLLQKCPALHTALNKDRCRVTAGAICFTPLPGDPRIDPAPA